VTVHPAPAEISEPEHFSYIRLTCLRRSTGLEPATSRTTTFLRVTRNSNHLARLQRSHTVARRGCPGWSSFVLADLGCRGNGVAAKRSARPTHVCERGRLSLPSPLDATMRLDDLIPVLGGQIVPTTGGARLETHVGGLRSCVIFRLGLNGAVTWNLAVYTSKASAIDPYEARDNGLWWWLGKEPVELPRLKGDFVFTGCRNGVLFAINTDETSIDSVVNALRDLAHWAQKPWRLVDGSSTPEEHRQRERESVLRAQARVRRVQGLLVGGMVLVVALLFWWYRGGDAAPLALLAALGPCARTVDNAVG
jgi:hypothetical protein